MAQFSPELIEETISVFERQTGREISHEEARQALENISGFFRVLQEWEDAEEEAKQEGGPGCPFSNEGGEP
jgi:hypothetical protein